jgi:hypothetical protein
LAVCLAAAGGARADELSDIKKRVEALERKESSRSELSKALDKTHFHGYGEVHYNNPKTDRMTHQNTSAETDVHRMVIGMGHEFTDTIRMDMEVDFEHAATEIELEYAHLEFDLNDNLSIRAGSMLIPVGSLNEFHEPPNFYSVERPRIHQYLIPTTWQENGAGFVGRALDDRLSYRLYGVSGLNAKNFDTANGLRSGRGKGATVESDDLAAVGRMEYRPSSVEGLQLGSSGYFGEADQDDTNNFHGNVNVGIYTADAKYRRADAEVKAEYVGIDLSNTKYLGSAAAPVGSRMSGWNSELAYHTASLVEESAVWDLVPFVRYEDFDTNENVASGRTRDGSAHREIWTYGLACYPIAQIAVKADVESWQDHQRPERQSIDRYNVGLAWMF